MKRLSLLAFSLALLGLISAVHTDFVRAEGCSPVHGTVMITSITEDTVEGMFMGDIEGPLSTTILESEEIETPIGTVTVLSAESSIETGEETINTVDHIALIPLGESGMQFWVGKHLVTSDERAVTGVIITFGVITPEGSGMLFYGGLLNCPREDSVM